MIKKSKGGGYKVVSKSGKNLSKPGLSKGAAKKRLAQVDHFTRKGGGIRSGFCGSTAA